MTVPSEEENNRKERKNIMEKSMLDVAYEIVSQRTEPITFKELVAQIVAELNLSEEECAKRISRFYTNLMLDGRFVTLGENTWDLRSRNKFEKVHIDMNDVYKDEDEDEENEDEDEDFNDEDSSEDDLYNDELKKSDIIIDADEEMEGE